ncbi:MAG: isoprenylcysteine carboxyl methyltransferase family protein [Deltaproteobacteria bacterium]
MSYFWLFFLFLILQRVAELIYASRNERVVIGEGAVEYDSFGYKAIAAMHTAFFISLLAEKLVFDTALNRFWIPLVLIFAAAQPLRYWAIASLGVYWNTKVLVSPNHKIVAAGPYKYLRHPNYAAVITEIAVVPLIFSCYFTASVFSLANLILLRRRIKVEEEALGLTAITRQ